MTENKRYVRILDYSEKEVRIFDEHNQKNIFNIFFEGLDSAICLKGALEDTVDLLNYFYKEKNILKEENEQLKSENKELQARYNHCIEEMDSLAEVNDKFYKENKELKAKVDDKEVAVEVECEKLMQKVLDLIDEKIKLYSHKPVSAPISQPMSVNFDEDVDRLARLSELEALKEELTR